MIGLLRREHGHTMQPAPYLFPVPTQHLPAFEAFSEAIHEYVKEFGDAAIHCDYLAQQLAYMERSGVPRELVARFADEFVKRWEPGIEGDAHGAGE